MKNLPEIIFASSDPSESRRIKKLLDNNDVRSLIPRVYTSNMRDPIDQIVRRNIWLLVAHIFPGAIISHRTAIEYQVSPKNNIYLTASSRRVYRWPGINIRIAEGSDPLNDDGTYIHNLRVSSLERACLENLLPSRKIDGEKRVVEQEVIENRLVDLLTTRGEKALNEFRDRARVIADKLNMKNEFDKLNQIIGSILSTRSSKVLTSARATAQAIGEPYDAGRLDLFSNLLAFLKQTTFPERKTRTTSEEAFSNFAFFEAYFSNYIEGTTFMISEAKEIVFDGVDIPLRIQDSHDIRGTYQIVSNQEVMTTTPNTGDELIDLLRSRHKVVLASRPEKNPGALKSRQNRAGDTVFVQPEFVIGTLKQGFALMASLNDPIARGIYMMFLICEVHPFDDGNGRIARIMMNAELVSGNTSKIITPTVYRDDYMLALRRLTRQSDPRVFVRTMDRVSEYSHWLNPITWDDMYTQLEESNAFKEPDQDGTILKWNK